jgi:hypothetical protein
MWNYGARNPNENENGDEERRGEKGIHRYLPYLPDVHKRFHQKFTVISTSQKPLLRSQLF